MNDVAAERWEFSLLVDRANCVLESRGQAELYLAVPAKRLIGSHLVGFFDETERLGFLRYMARLMVRGDADPVSATLRSTGMGLKKFSIAARKGDGRSNWWIMFSQETRAERGALDDGADPFASGEEFAVLADARGADQPPMDITVFRARALSDGTAALSTEQQAALDDSLGRSLIEHAHEHIVARPQKGEYAFMHAENQPVEQIERQLASVAARHNLADIGLVRETRHLEPGESASAVISEMRRKLERPISVQADPEPARRRPMWIPAVGVGVCCILAVAAWMALR